MTLSPLFFRFWFVGGGESGGRERSPGQAEKTAVKSIKGPQVRLVMNVESPMLREGLAVEGLGLDVHCQDLAVEGLVGHLEGLLGGQGQRQIVVRDEGRR